MAAHMSMHISVYTHVHANSGSDIPARPRSHRRDSASRLRQRVCAEQCIDVCIGVYMNACVDVGICMRMGVRIDMCIDMRRSMPAEMLIGTPVSACWACV